MVGAARLAGRPSRTLILTLTRACDLRCSYCPTAKDGWPSLNEEDARRAVRLFADRFGGGDVKLFGGEPLLLPHVVRAAFDAARDEPRIRRVYLSTNGLALDAAWLRYIEQQPKAVLTLSMDGGPTDHRRFRRPAPGQEVADTYDHILALLPQLRRTKRVVITQTIPPASAARGAANFEHLLGLGLWRFNLLPGYYLPWKLAQLDALRASFEQIAALIEGRWERGEALYLRNLFTFAPTPFFNTGLVVDSDRSIHPSNVALSGDLEALGELCRVGSLDDPPSLAELDAAAERSRALLQRALPEGVWRSTLRVDAELTRLCDRLYPSWAAKRRRRQATAAEGLSP